MSDSTKIVIAYGLVEKNKVEIKLKCKDDYLKLARAFARNAEEYSELVFCCTTHRFADGGMAIWVNACFACELYLKALLLNSEVNFYSEIKKPEDKHDLFDLFNHLPLELRQKIENGRYTNIPQGHFRRELEEIGKGFEVIRYMPECFGMMVNCVFLLQFMNNLQHECWRRIPKESDEESHNAQITEQ